MDDPSKPAIVGSQLRSVARSDGIRARRAGMDASHLAQLASGVVLKP
jgi:hypothetical protein